MNLVNYYKSLILCLVVICMGCYENIEIIFPVDTFEWVGHNTYLAHVFSWHTFISAVRTMEFFVKVIYNMDLFGSKRPNRTQRPKMTEDPNYIMRTGPNSRYIFKSK